MKGSKGAFHSMKGQAGRSALLKLSGGNSADTDELGSLISASIVGFGKKMHLYKFGFLKHSVDI